MDNHVATTANLDLIRESIVEKFGEECANVMDCLAQGLSRRKTALQLGIKYREVDKHIDTLSEIFSAAYRI